MLRRIMAKIACYTPDGELKMKEPIDARECVEALGFTMEKPSEAKENIIDIKLTKKGLIFKAESKGIELDGNETKAVLIEKIESLNEGE
jgi:hypothetical protein